MNLNQLTEEELRFILLWRAAAPQDKELVERFAERIFLSDDEREVLPDSERRIGIVRHL